ncbi:MAG: hypothetical protein FD152_677 [Xanthobacteraceae bacterium]|nr:MAG: hypothetical protein FD152_677 [Xanthobacteraceae bacterium]
MKLDLRAAKALEKRIIRQPGKRAASMLGKRVRERLTVGTAYHLSRRGHITVRVYPRFRRPTVKLEDSEVAEVMAIVRAAVIGKLLDA